MHTIRLDLESLVQDGKISPEEAICLEGFAQPSQKGGLLINLLLIFGAISVAAGTIALLPNAATDWSSPLSPLAELKHCAELTLMHRLRFSAQD